MFATRRGVTSLQSVCLSMFAQQVAACCRRQLLTGYRQEDALRNAGRHSVRGDAHVEAHIVPANPLQAQHLSLADEQFVATA